MLLQRSRYVFSINYGKALDSLDGDQNNAALVLNSIFDESSGGGDPSLFLDSPVTQHQLFHMFSTEYQESNKFLNVYEIWGMVGIKAIPPSAVLLRHLQQNNQPFIP